MDFTLRCNSLKCRSQLNDRAVVTTCSHIFCIQCSEQLGLANAAGHRNCPACRTVLANPDDVVATQLNPTEDYKTSVLSGLSPTVIMECAGRGLAFWSYQSTQEIVYQEYLAKTLTDKYSTLNHQLDKVIGDANSEIENLNQRLNQMHLDQTKLKTDNTQLLAALREKNRKHAQTQELYDRLKAKEMTAATQQHAFDSADDVLQSAVRSQVQGHGQGHQNHQNQNGYNQNQGINLDIHQLRRQGPSPLGGHFSGSGGRRSTSPNKMHQTSHFVGDRNGVMGPPPIPRPGQGIGNSGFVTHPTPQHRTRLGGLSATFATNTNTNSSGGNALFRTNATNSFGPNSFQAQGQGQGQGQGQTPRIRRPPLGPISGNTPSAGLGGGSGVSGYGMSAGMRSGSVLGGTGSGSGDGVGGGGFGWEHGGF